MAAVLVICGLSAPCTADRYLTYSSTQTAEVNSNPRQSADSDTGPSYGVRTAFSPTLGYEAPTSGWSVNPQFRAQRFGGIADQDQEFFVLAANARRSLTERLSLSGTGSFQLDSNQTVLISDDPTAPELFDPDITANRQPIEQQNKSLSANLGWQSSERLQFSLFGSFNERTFSGADTSGFSAFDTKAAGVSVNWVWTDRTSLNASISRSHFKTFNGDNVTDDNSLNLGFSHTHSPTLSFSASVGARLSTVRTRQQQFFPLGQQGDIIFGELRTVESETDDVGQLFNISATRALPRGALAASYSRSLSPRGTGAQSENDALNFTWSHSLSERWSATLAASQGTTRAQGGVGPQNLNREVNALNAQTRYQLSRKWTLSATWAYQRGDAGVGAGEQFENHTVSMGLSYASDRLDW